MHGVKIRGTAGKKKMREDEGGGDESDGDDDDGDDDNDDEDDGDDGDDERMQRQWGDTRSKSRKDSVILD